MFTCATVTGSLMELAEAGLVGLLLGLLLLNRRLRGLLGLLLEKAPDLRVGRNA
mgnify:CR=1 FL=1